MKIRININSVKNAMGTVFLLAATFFVCSTFVSMRSVFADPIVQNNNVVRTSGRISPRATQNNRVNVSRTTAVRTPGAVTKTSGKTAVSRGVGTRSVSSRSITPTRSNNVASRNVVSRNKSGTRTTQNRSVRARSATTPSRVSANGSVISGTRAGTSVTYLTNKLYTGYYSNIVDSTTGLIAADAYSNCMESYYTCMDEICTARSDTKGRCSCAGRVGNFLNAETALEKANEELISLSGQLSLLIATKGKGDDLAAAFSLTDAEKVMNCVSYKENVQGKKMDEKEWYEQHPTVNASGAKQTSGMPTYCDSRGNSFGFDISNIDGSSSDILAQLKSWADAKDLAKEYTDEDNSSLATAVLSVDGIISEMNETTRLKSEDVSIDKLANKWGYDLFQYAHNNVCGRVLDSCFNGIYEACGTPPSITEDKKTVRIKCGNGETSNCPFNYNSNISVNDGEIVVTDSASMSSNLSAMSQCFGYSSSTSSTSVRTTTSTSSDPYAQLRGPVADARRSIINKYLLDANAACDTYGAALKQTAQNINYQKIAAEQALQAKRLEFKQEADAQTVADAQLAIDNFNECISEIWDCYDEYSDEDKWTTARIKAYCSQVSQVPHCYETMVCSPLQTQLIAVVDKPDSSTCTYSNDYSENTCRNVVTINEILYGTGTNANNALDNWNSIGKLTLNSAAVRENCLERVLGCYESSAVYEGVYGQSETYCLRKWKKGDNNSTLEGTGTLGKGEAQGTKGCTQNELDNLHASAGYISNDNCIIISCKKGYILEGGVCNELCVDADLHEKSDYATSGRVIDGVCKIVACSGLREASADGDACDCPTNYVDANNGDCVRQKRSCSAAALATVDTNATGGTQDWDQSTDNYGTCEISSCKNGYRVDKTNNQCVSTSSN